MEKIIVREMRKHEKAQVKELFEQVFSHTFSNAVPNFEEVTKGEKLYVALLEDTVAGMASVWEPDSFIHFLFVSPAARHKNVGSTLISRLAALYDAPLTLKCLTKNTPAMAFYQATGWKELEKGVSEEGEYSLLRYEKN